MRQRKGNSVGDRLLMILVGLFLYAPIIILIVFSFNAGNSSSVWKGFSLHWYAELLNDRLIMHSVYTTLLVSLLATVIATVAGTFAAIGFYGMRRRARTGLMAVNNIPMMNADIVTGVSLCLLFVVFFNGWHSFAVWVNGWQSLVVLPERLTLGFGTLLIAHICFNIPYVILSVGPKLRQMDRNLVDAAQDLGCTWTSAVVTSKFATAGYSMGAYSRLVCSKRIAPVATTTSPLRTSSSIPPQVPTRINVSAPMLCSSSMAMEAEGPPIPVEQTETFSPSSVPV